MKTTINFRVTCDVKEQLEILSEEYDESISKVIRDIIIHNLRRRGLLEEEEREVFYINLSDLDLSEAVTNKNFKNDE
ncbi:hypothetical protein [Lacinutrix sp. 5H-3-7-4]|uniref:hypothetical protein n=1 Tax=Lacinutrix sp. (strain 5H-3-7-4) TaxID=983544 RepID=UPI00020A33E4|nr:hypothetical protein [Lacinutrix sp. 5H-3-7-4]AEH01402.1 hypothetical protein Lacal_1554 [Lacinutrix sp. 5H-3-7-4]